MDIVTVLIGVAVFIISAVVIYFISAFSMREKTFEEVMEEQKRRNEEEREKAKAGKKEKDPKKKFKKGKADKAKPVAEPELKAEPKMVNLEIEPEIIQPTESLPLKEGVRQRGKKEKNAKPILHNKDEIVPTVAKTTEFSHKVVAKDEVEIKKGKKNEEKVVVEKVQKSKAAPTQQEVKVKESKQKATMESKENLPPKKATPKGTPVKQVKSEDSGLVSTIKTAKLSDEEQQSIIEILVSRQGGSIPDSWNKKSQKGDPIALMKRQLEEKERSLQEEQSLAMSANNKVKQLRNEIGAEKVKYDALEKSYAEKLNGKHKEMEALQKRVQHSHEQHMMETQGLQARIKQLEQVGGGDQANLQKLVAENKILQDTLIKNAKEMAIMSGKVKSMEKDSDPKVLEAAEAKARAAQAKVTELEKKMKDSSGSKKQAEDLMNKRVEEVAAQLRQSEEKNDSLASKLKETEEKTNSLSSQLKQVEEKSNSVSAELKQSEDSRSSLDSDLQKANQALATTTTEVSTLKLKLEELESSLSKADASREAELQEAKGKQSDLSGNVKNLEKQLADITKRLSESEEEKNKLKSENSSLSSEVKQVNEKLSSAAPATNGPSVSEEEHQKIVSGLKVEVDNQKASVTDLEQQLAQQKSKNNELREKNWKAMEALEKAEKNSSDKPVKSARDDAEANDKAVFQRLFPSVKVSDKLAHKDWIVEFEKEAAKQVQNTEVEDDNQRLKSEVEQYRNIVSETENKLKQLEKSIEAEEKNWEEKLKQAQSSQSSNSDSQGRISELEKLVSDQEKQMEQYRSVLSSTENSLKELESKVSSEESSWQGKLIASDAQLVQTQGELADLKKQLTDSSGSEEDEVVIHMQAKVETLEAMLKESQDKVLTLTTEKRTMEKKLQSDSSSGSDKEVSELKATIDSERKKNKDLCLNVVKLNGIIKTGQDALSQEQELVKKLQEQLDTKSVKSGVSEMDELDQLRSKLSEKQKLLEREMTVNKQLSERLAASSTAENGTSV